MKITFQKCTAKDLDAIDEMYIGLSIAEGKQQFPNVTKKEMQEQLNKYKRDRRKGFLSELKKPKTNFWYFAKVDSEIAGFIHAQLEKKYNFAKIEKIYVKKKYRGKGIAQKLMNFILKKLKESGIKRVESSIFAKNESSIKLHERLGFKQISVKFRKDIR